MQISLGQQEWPSDPIHCLTRMGKCRRVSRHFRQILGELPISVIRNQNRASKFLGCLGFGSASSRSWVDIAYMRRYLLSLRKANDGCLSYAFSADKSRGSGRDWLSSSCRGYESRQIGWMQPVVPQKSMRTPPRGSENLCFFKNQSYFEVPNCLKVIQITAFC